MRMPSAFPILALILTFSLPLLGEEVVTVHWIDGSYTYEDSPKSFRLVIEACTAEDDSQCLALITFKKILLGKDDQKIALKKEISRRKLEAKFKSIFSDSVGIGKIIIRILHYPWWRLPDYYSDSKIPYSDILSKPNIELDLNSRENPYSDPSRYSAFLNSRISIQFGEQAR